jgi:NodT family efflux transporter outer membrane factor (OMF) lipoprotein
MHIKQLLICFLFGIVTSCSLFNYRNDENILTPPLVSTEKALDVGVFQFGNWPTEDWWKIFKSEELSTLIENGLKENPSLNQAEEKIEQAKQIALQQRSFLFPWISFNFNEDWSHISKNGLYKAFNPKLPLNGNLLNIGLMTNYTFDFWSQYRNIFQAALGEVRSAEAEKKQADLIISTAIAQSYFSLKINLERKRLYERLLTLRSKLANLENLLQIKALKSNLPVYLANEELEEARKSVFAIDEEIEIGQHLINVLVGVGPEKFRIPYSYICYAPTEITIPKEISLNLLSRRPDLTAAIWHIEAMGHLVGAQVANFFPNINLQSLLGFQSFEFNQLLKKSSLTAALTPAINLPVFTAGNIRAGINEKKAEFEQAVYQYNELLLKAVREVTDNLVIVNTFYQKKESQRVIVENALFGFSLTDLRMKSGLDNILEVYIKEIELIMKRLQDLDLLYGQYFSLIELIKSLGGGYLSEFSNEK